MRRTIGRRWFEQAPLDVAQWNLFDIGVVDRRTSGALDIFTVNHNSRQSLLENEGGGRFREAFGGLGLDQDRSFPSWSDDVRTPTTDRPGLYLYRRGNAIVLRSVHPDAQAAIRGDLIFQSPLRELAVSPITANIPGDRAGTGPTVVRFAAGRPGDLELRPELVGLPVTVRLDEVVPLDRVFVGPSMTRPPAHEFSLRLQDRHGMAWTRQGAARPPDLFVARGGLRGRIGRIGSPLTDELFVDAGNGAGYEDVADEFGVRKGFCRSRQAAWVAIPGWSGLHLFVSCHGGPPQLHRPGPDKRFVNVAARVGLDHVTGQHFSWVDVDGDGCAELVAVDGDQLTVHRYDKENDRFDQDQILALRGSGVRKLAVGDHNGDGRPDLFAPSPDGNTLLIRDGDRYVVVDPRSAGLPGAGGVTAAWVDYDNDGLVDLHVLPGGLYRQLPGGGFEATRHLDRDAHTAIADGRVTWFDAAGSGARDALVATVATSKADGGGFDWKVRLFRNAGAANHWLHVDLLGPPGNPQALGAAVSVEAGGRFVTQWVGCNEGSHFSQGHYRLYFGLGRKAHAESVTINWPGGLVRQLRRVAGDRLVRIAYPGSAVGESCEPVHE